MNEVSWPLKHDFATQKHINNNGTIGCNRYWKIVWCYT